MMDGDMDGIPDACDACPNDATNDGDGDGICEDLDICIGFNDNADTDGDGVPNGCDDCASSATGDSDNDGICDDADACPGGDDTIDTNNNGTPDDCEMVSVQLKVMLEGESIMNTGMMERELNVSNLLPLAQPYHVAPYNYLGTESLSLIPSQMVDWVLVEVRTGTPNLTGSKGTTTIAQAAGLLMTDGNIIGLNSSSLEFNLPAGGQYYFVVRHRNHLDIMTATPSPRALVINYDFTTSVAQAFGSLQQKMLSSGVVNVAVMYAGDINQDHVIQTTDFDVWQLQPAKLNTYEPSDANMDGLIQVTDYDLWFLNNAKVAPVELDY